VDHRDRHQGRHQDVDLHPEHQHQAHQHQDVGHQNQGEGHLGHQDVDHQVHQRGDHQDLDVCQGRDEYQDRDDYQGLDAHQDLDGIRMVRQDGTQEQFADQVEAEWDDQMTTLGQEGAGWVDHLDVRQVAFQEAFQEESPLDDLAAVLDVALAAD
jgi:hypothetical protein